MIPSCNCGKTFKYSAVFDDAGRAHCSEISGTENARRAQTNRRIFRRPLYRRIRWKRNSEGKNRIRTGTEGIRFRIEAGNNVFGSSAHQKSALASVLDRARQEHSKDKMDSANICQGRKRRCPNSNSPGKEINQRKRALLRIRHFILGIVVGRRWLLFLLLLPAIPFLFRSGAILRSPWTLIEIPFFD